MSDELKVCPFCGGDARIHSKVLAEGFDSGYWAVCDECGKGDTLPHESEEEAAAAWNARAERTCRNTDTVPDDGSVFYPSPHFRCSECGASYALTGYAYYCPNCGAKVAG